MPQKTRHKPYLANLREKHPTIAADATAYSSGGKNTFDEQYTTFIKSVETLDRAIRVIANTASLAELHLGIVDTDGAFKQTKVDNIDFEYPNETDSSIDLWRKLFVSIFTQGAGLLITEEGPQGNRKEKLINWYSIDVARITAESTGKKLIDNFIYTSEDGADTSYPANKCVYINDSIDPSNLLYSLSRLKALNDVILLQAGIVHSSKEKILGGAKDSVIVSSESPISPQNMEIIKQEFNSFMKSATSGSMFMNTKLDVSTVGTSMSGSEMLEFFQKLNQMMLDHFNIPPYLLGDYQSGANRSTEVTYALRTFFTSQLKPVFMNIEKQVTRFLRYELGLENITAKFNYDNVDILQLPYEEKVDTALKMHKSGVLSINETRRICEFNALADAAADKHYLPAFLVGSAPISLEEYDTDLERALNRAGAGAEEDLPAGSAGDEDNTNKETDSRGGTPDE